MPKLSVAVPRRRHHHTKFSVGAYSVFIVLYFVVIIISIHWSELFLEQLGVTLEDSLNDADTRDQNPSNATKGFRSLNDLHPASRDKLWIKYGKHVLVSTSVNKLHVVWRANLVLICERKSLYGEL